MVMLVQSTTNHTTHFLLSHFSIQYETRTSYYFACDRRLNQGHALFNIESLLVHTNFLQSVFFIWFLSSHLFLSFTSFSHSIYSVVCMHHQVSPMHLLSVTLAERCMHTIQLHNRNRMKASTANAKKLLSCICFQFHKNSSNIVKLCKTVCTYQSGLKY
jgi:hypothetical protein